MKKKVAKVKRKLTKVSVKVSKHPAFDPKLHIKLSELAAELKLDYRSLFMKQKRQGIFGIKCLLKGREVVCFTNESADKIRACTAPFITKSHVELTTIEEQCHIDRPRMLRVLAKLGITAEKRRRFEENPRSVLTVKQNTVKRIKEGVKSLL